MDVDRISTITIGHKSLPLPVYFPSVSSMKTTLKPLEYLQVLCSLTNLNKQFLVSAFDLSTIEDPLVISQMLRSSMESGAVILMDSGNYESFWKDAKSDWKQHCFHDVLRAFPCNLAFCYDEQNPPIDINTHIEHVVLHWQKDQAGADNRMVVPIIHGTTSDLPILCKRVAEITGVKMVAVAERNLGSGVIARARMVASIRQQLNKLGRYVALHLLGTGNPISIALYSIHGADSFDGLEWCQTVIDHETALLYHLSQSDFFEQQTAWGDAGLSFYARTLAHNLEFYSNWMQRLREAILNGKSIEFCRIHFPERIFRQCNVAFGWNKK